MPPTLRSSPAHTRTTRNSTKSPPPLATPPRPRYCTNCKRPRKGHPREGCPYADSDRATPSRSSGSTHDGSPPGGVAHALSELNLAAADTDTEEETPVKARTRELFTPMPGALLTTAPSWMFSEPSSSQASSICKDEYAQYLPSSQEDVDQYLALSQPSESQMTERAATPLPPNDCAQDAQEQPQGEPRPLTRTLTAAERADFADSLAHLAKATLYVLPTADVPAICAAAAAHGLHARAVDLAADRASSSNNNNNGNNRRARNNNKGPAGAPYDPAGPALSHADTLLAIGHTQAAVDVLCFQVAAKMHALVPPPGTPRSLLTTSLAASLAASLVGAAGAAAAWSVLAFS